MKRLIALLLCLGLCGCATTSMNRGLTAMVGRNIQTAFDALGYPTDKKEFGSDTVYYWSVHEPGYDFSNNCLIKLVADKDGIIKTYEWSGNEGGLARYASRLDRYYNRSVKSTETGNLH